MIATASGHKTLRKQRIIERPRLIKLLTDSKARVLAFVAPAGYGKTTLADQWIASDGRSGARFRARRASTDVAALALDVAKTASAIVPGCDERLREHLRAVPAPPENVEVLAEILGEDLADWPSAAWLVIDEYQEIAGATEAESFVGALIDASPAQLVVASRQRPSWAVHRRVVYGELSVLTQDDLAMDEHETSALLAKRGDPASPDLIALAGGWPAVIGLASVSSADIKGRHQVSRSLYDFFAEEIFTVLDERVREGLLLLSIPPLLTEPLAADLLGRESAEVVCATALDVGIMVERGEQLELHPLARQFLQERAERTVASARAVAATCVAHYRGQRDWDAAFDVISRVGPHDELASTLLQALDDLLETARLPTIEAWCRTADELGLESQIFALARAEAALRRAHLTEAQTYAEAAASVESDLTYRALCIAGRAAHLASREEEAVGLFRRAEDLGRSDAERREALWSQVNCLVDMESPEAAEILDGLRSTLVRSDPTDVVRSAGVGLAYQFKFGSLDLEEADRAYELLEAVRDPIARASFQSIYAVALGLASRYDDALSVASSLVELAGAVRLDFAVPYGHTAAATAHAGLREWGAALAHVDDALAAARAGNNTYAEQVAIATKIRVLAQQGEFDRALALSVPERRRSLPAGTAEVLASRALALAAASRLDEASTLVCESAGLSSAIEPNVLAAATKAIVLLKAGSQDAVDETASLVETVWDSGALDILVTAYRSVPALLRLLLRDTDRREDIARLVARAGDDDVAEAVGRPLGLEDRRSLLSAREREVLELLESGLTNSQIAATLVISQATARLHSHRVYEKLGVRSRRELAFRALQRKSSQATSAIDDTGESSDEPSVL